MSASGREVAAQVLARVLSEGSWIAPTLDRALEREKMPPREAARATDLVYAATRSLYALDREIDKHRPKKQALETFTRAVLATSVMELVGHPDQAHAIAHEAVKLVRAERGEGLARFVNAILRRCAEKPIKLAGRMPPPIYEVIARGVGRPRASAIAMTLEGTPMLGLRAEIDRAELARKLTASELRLGTLSSRAILLRGAGDPRALPGYTEGWFAVQEEGAQVLGSLLDAQPGDRVADVCAGHGGKTAVLARAVGPSGSVVALDLHQPKLDRIAPELARLRIATPVQTRAADLTVGIAGLAAHTFDRVLVDAPCTGLGTVARRPEILLRIQPTDPARMAETQRAILRTAASLVKPGGRLVYAVCSPTQEEGAQVIQQFLSETPSARLVRLDGADEDGILRIGPWSDPAADAYTAAAFSLEGSSQGPLVRRIERSTGTFGGDRCRTQVGGGIDGYGREGRAKLEIKINLGILVFLVLVWGSLSWTTPGAALDPMAEQTRSLRVLEDRFAHEHGNATLAQDLADAYLDLDHPEFAVATLTAAEPDVMTDPGVEHRLARAYERMGRVDDALGTAEVALAQCGRSLGTEDASAITPIPARGCTERLYAALSMHRDALARMHAWGVTDPRTDPRAPRAYGLAVRAARVMSASAE